MSATAPRPAPPEEAPVLIVGAGISGLAMAHELRLAGISFLVLEGAEGVGGTWRHNRYPGAACDIPSHLYSFSWSTSGEWSHHFAPQPEILAYLEGVARAEGLGPRLRLGARVVEARWEEGGWTLRCADGRRFRGRHLALGQGALHEPLRPELPGRFGGLELHSARWPEGLDLRGQRVAVVGTGASAVQIVPAIAPQVAELHLFQRSAPWVLPRMGGPIPGWQRALWRQAPLRRLLRWAQYAWRELQTPAFVWYPGALGLLERLSRAHRAAVLGRGPLYEALEPNYRLGCKRIMMSDDFYPALTLPQVRLHSGGLRALEEGACVGAQGQRVEVDALIWCTGFAATAALRRFPVWGPAGELGPCFDADPSSWLGVMKAGFPNLFLLMGPNTGLGNNSMVFMIEAQARYARQAIQRCLEGGHPSIEVRRDRQEEEHRSMMARFPGSIWASGCAAWYQDSQGRHTAIWPGLTSEYWWRCRRLEPRDHELR